MSEAPYLSLRDLEEEVRAIHRTKHRSLNVALYGRGEPALLNVALEGGRSFQAVPVRCELELRQALQQAADTPLVLLVDYGTDLPLDVEARLAGGRIHFVADARRVARLFGASAASPELLESPLAKALLEDPGAQAGPLPGATVDLETAWRWFLHRRVALPNEPGLPEDRILAFCAASSAGPEFGRYLQERPRLRQALYEFLDRSAGPVARIAWRAWETGQGRKIAALTLLMEAAAPKLAYEPYLKASMVRLLEQIAPDLRDTPSKDPALLLRWGELAGRLVLRLKEDPLLSPLLEEAQALLPDEDVRDALAEGRYLPGAFQRTADLLGEALARAAEENSLGHFRTAAELLARLGGHHLARMQSERIERARMAMRLLAYRRERPDFEELARHGPPYEEMVLLAQAYAREGGYVDYALRVARGSASDALGAGVEKVVATIEALRDEDDARFARGLGAWIRAGRKSDRVVPIDTALDRFAVQFLEGGAHRKLLVLLLDGMAWANAVELLMDLEAHQVAPVRWRPKGELPRALLPPMIAALPTVTEVSRSAFFAGRLLAPGELADTDKDPDRFAEHRGLSKLVGVLPRLLLRRDVQLLNGAASEQARKLVLSEGRVVALVVNAIDEQLKGGRQIRVEYRLQTIKPLRDLLDAAAEAGRAVLMVADHGHVPGSRMSRLAVPVEVGGARWRTLREDEPAHANEVEFSEDAVWRLRGKKRVALLFREADTYGVTSHEGEHGGASLAEAVAPAILVASESLARRYEAEGHEDREVEVVSFPRPRWWDYEVRPVQVTTPKPAPPPTVPNQEAFAFRVPSVPGPRALEAPVARPQPRAPAKQKAPPSPVGALLRKSPLFKDIAGKKREELEDKIIPWVEVLVEHEGRMPPDVFAQRTGELPFRVRGAVTKLSEWLNLDGQPVAFFDEAEKVVRLDVEALKQMFGGGK